MTPQRPAEIFYEDQCRELIGFDREALDAIRNGFIALSAGNAELPPIMHIDVKDHEGDIDIKSAYVRGLDYVAVKIAAGFPGNQAIGLPNCPAMMAVLHASTGTCAAVLLDNGYLTDLRTGLAGAVAADALARKNARHAGIVGASVQARFQLRALMLVRSIDAVTIWARRTEQAQAFADEVKSWGSVTVHVVQSVGEVIANSDIVVTTTSSRAPVITSETLRPGQHITAVGSDLPGKRELSLDILAQADLIVCDRIDQCKRLGELQDVGLQNLRIGRLHELGDVLANPIERSDEAITICDLTGTGVQDTAIASELLRRVG
jgi:ornithine cyclodeaminase/alanine dehydrogenase-like protein (mu-crystallin family)